MTLTVQSIIEDSDKMMEIGKLAAEHHPENFSNFENRINSYYDFFVVSKDDEPLAISGIFRYKRWFPNLYRIADRSFYFPINRDKSLGYLGGITEKTILSHLLIPRQTQMVLDMGGIPFYSMLRHKNALKRSTERHNEISKNKYVVLDDLYFTCPFTPEPNDRCWQYIAVLEQHKGLFNDKTLRHGKDT